ncbi:uncharacterized protein SCHCODRAFT_02520768 [Schizophyllum commune H4-8]|nr:uncharacterized protein SCHCODRAFT_02520768 [Schizophyllum commune H4-8]KAI5885457.1 hypothetical protein SCHCODRAFT_02520768 [Schizophyllum commune H4-8]
MTRGMRHTNVNRDGRGDSERLPATRRECSLYTSFSQAGHTILETHNGAEAGYSVAAQARGCSSVANQSAVYPGSQGRSTRSSNPSELRPCRPACYIDRLPNELLCAIFILCGYPNLVSGFPRDTFMHDLDVYHQRIRPYSRTAVLLGRVCSRWFVVTRNYPALWTLADVLYPGRGGLNTLICCLNYSAGLPIALHICDAIPLANDSKGPDSRFMPLVAANANRWKELSVYLLDCQDVKPLLAPPPGSFTSLDRAHLCFVRGKTDASSPDTQLWRSLFTSPHLRHANLTRAQYVSAGLAVAPFGQLSSLGVRLSSPDQISSLLSQRLDNLEVLLIDVDDYGPDEQNDSPHHPVCLPRLTALMLCGASSKPSPLFKQVTVPALVRLDISCGIIQPQEIEDMIRRSSARIRMLTLYRLHSRQADNIVALLRSPTLLSLRILRYVCQRGYMPSNRDKTFDMTPYVPPHVDVFTEQYSVAEAAYESLYM